MSKWYSFVFLFFFIVLGGPIGGCQISTHGESFNMGYIQSKPVVVGDGTIVLRYRNGDLCHRGTPKQAHRSTRITLVGITTTYAISAHHH
jgi:hypothetical protein